MAGVTIYTNRVVPPWDPRWATDARAPGLGGSEECVALLAAALAERHRVQVYASLPPDAPVPAQVDGVTYWPREAFDPRVEREVLITWKDNEPHVAYPRRAEVALHWSSDVEPESRWPAGLRPGRCPGNRGASLHLEPAEPLSGASRRLPAVGEGAALPSLSPFRGEREGGRGASKGERAGVSGVDAVVALSAYHARRIAFLAPVVIPHGVPKRYVKRAEADGARQVPGKRQAHAAGKRPVVVYCSSPDRGLAYVLSHWPAIQRALGAEQLIVTYPFPPQGALPSLPGVTYLGALPAEQWDRLLAQARWWIHPVQGPAGPVPDAELFCLNAVKAQALGCMPVVPRSMIEAPLPSTSPPSPLHLAERGALPASGLADTVKRYVDLSELIRAGDCTVRDNPLAARELPLTWRQVVDKHWAPLLRPHPRPLSEGEGWLKAGVGGRARTGERSLLTTR